MVARLERRLAMTYRTPKGGRGGEKIHMEKWSKKRKEEKKRGKRRKRSGE